MSEAPTQAPGKKRRAFALIAVCAVLLMPLALLRHRNTERRKLAANNALAQRERTYKATADTLQQAIPKATTRSEVELLLNRRSLPFELRPGNGTHDEIVPLAHEASPKWFCNYEQVQVLIEFTPDQAVASTVQSSTGFSTASPTDRVKSVRLDHRLRDCI